VEDGFDRERNVDDMAGSPRLGLIRPFPDEQKLGSAGGVRGGGGKEGAAEGENKERAMGMGDDGDGEDLWIQGQEREEGDDEMDAYTRGSYSAGLRAWDGSRSSREVLEREITAQLLRSRGIKLSPTPLSLRSPSRKWQLPSDTVGVVVTRTPREEATGGSSKAARYNRGTALFAASAGAFQNEKCSSDAEHGRWRSTHSINFDVGSVTYVPTPRTSKLGQTSDSTPYAYRTRLAPPSLPPPSLPPPPLHEWRALRHWGTPRKSRMLRSTENEKVVLPDDGATGSLDGLYSGYVARNADGSKVATRRLPARQGLDSLCHWRRLGVGHGSSSASAVKSSADLKKEEWLTYLEKSRGPLPPRRPWDSVK